VGRNSANIGNFSSRDAVYLNKKLNKKLVTKNIDGYVCSYLSCFGLEETILNFNLFQEK
jgi:hypothetical protein